MYSINNFIALGGCCLSVYVLGPERIKGPVDNVLLKYIELKDVIITRKGQKQKNKVKLQFIEKVNKLLK